MNELIDARRRVNAAKASGDPSEIEVAYAKVHAANIAFGEHGRV
jgi:hypothetical protein